MTHTSLHWLRLLSVVKQQLSKLSNVFIYCYIVYIFGISFPIRTQHTQTLLLKCQPQNTETMLSTLLGFPIGKRAIDHCSILAPEAVGFFPRVTATMNLSRVIKNCRNKLH